MVRLLTQELETAVQFTAGVNCHGDQVQWVAPILRIFDIAKADECYQEFLGFSVDWDHCHAPGALLCRPVSRGHLILHLSEQHDDGSPGARIRVMMEGVQAFHAEIRPEAYRYMWPGLQTRSSGMLEIGVIDPFGTLIRLRRELSQGGCRQERMIMGWAWRPEFCCGSNLARSQRANLFPAIPNSRPRRGGGHDERAVGIVAGASFKLQAPGIMESG
jgi:hypothetical protein